MEKKYEDLKVLLSEHPEDLKQLLESIDINKFDYIKLLELLPGPVNLNKGLIEIFNLIPEETLNPTKLFELLNKFRSVDQINAISFLLHKIELNRFDVNEILSCLKSKRIEDRFIGYTIASNLPKESFKFENLEKEIRVACKNNHYYICRIILKHYAKDLNCKTLFAILDNNSDGNKSTSEETLLWMKISDDDLPFILKSLKSESFWSRKVAAKLIIKHFKKRVSYTRLFDCMEAGIESIQTLAISELSRRNQKIFDPMKLSVYAKSQNQVVCRYAISVLAWHHQKKLATHELIIYLHHADDDVRKKICNILLDRYVRRFDSEEIDYKILFEIIESVDKSASRDIGVSALTDYPVNAMSVEYLLGKLINNKYETTRVVAELLLNRKATSDLDPKVLFNSLRSTTPDISDIIIKLLRKVPVSNIEKKEYMPYLESKNLYFRTGANILIDKCISAEPKKISPLPDLLKEFGK